VDRRSIIQVHAWLYINDDCPSACSRSWSIECWRHGWSCRYGSPLSLSSPSRPMGQEKKQQEGGHVTSPPATETEEAERGGLKLESECEVDVNAERSISFRNIGRFSSAAGPCIHPSSTPCTHAHWCHTAITALAPSRVKTPRLRLQLQVGQFPTTTSLCVLQLASGFL
jgi:hypothetical protein